jgi:hypothetical protein
VPTEHEALEAAADEIARLVIGVAAAELDVQLEREAEDAFDEPTPTVEATASLAGERAVRVACDAELADRIALHVYGPPADLIDGARARSSLAALARAVAPHLEVIQHPHWPFRSQPAQAADGEIALAVTACTLWFECFGRPLRIELLSK